MHAFFVQLIIFTFEKLFYQCFQPSQNSISKQKQLHMKLHNVNEKAKFGN
jgi:hypothetical protein